MKTPEPVHEQRGRGETPQAHSHHAHAHARDHGAGVDGVVVDPVCGMSVSPGSPHVATHADKEYRLCSAGCRTKFLADPARYLKAALHPEGTWGAEAPAGSKYTCPMHPEIIRDAPGSCPICGMALEPVMPSLDDDENPELRNFRRRFWWTLPLSLLALATAMLGHRFDLMSASARTWIELTLTAPVVLWGGWPFSSAGRSPSRTAARTCGR